MTLRFNIYIYIYCFTVCKYKTLQTCTVVLFVYTYVDHKKQAPNTHRICNIQTLSDPLHTCMHQCLPAMAGSSVGGGTVVVAATKKTPHSTQLSKDAFVEFSIKTANGNVQWLFYHFLGNEENDNQHSVPTRNILLADITNRYSYSALIFRNVVNALYTQAQLNV